MMLTLDENDIINDCGCKINKMVFFPLNIQQHLVKITKKSPVPLHWLMVQNVQLQAMQTSTKFYTLTHSTFQKDGKWTKLLEYPFLDKAETGIFDECT